MQSGSLVIQSLPQACLLEIITVHRMQQVYIVTQFMHYKK